MHPLAAYLLIFPLAAQADLYKCMDDTGKITYTNSVCAKMGLKQAKVIPPPPPPPVPEKSARKNEPAKPASAKAGKAADGKGKETVALQVVKPTQANSDKCARLNAAMGKVLDEMDAARRSGRSTENAAWDKELKTLQADKNRLGCF
ncbi:MAG: DUF4124 domain-containing protein [Pseudomonadota bacterium]